jgi:hypothetical protein
MTCGKSVVSPISSTNKTDHHDIADILLKVALNTITLTLTHNREMFGWCGFDGTLTFNNYNLQL